MGQPTATLRRLVASLSSLMGRRLTQEEELQAYENIGSYFFLDDTLSAHSAGRVEGTYVVPPDKLMKVAPREDRTSCLNPTQFERHAHARRLASSPPVTTPSPRATMARRS